MTSLYSVVSRLGASLVRNWTVVSTSEPDLDPISLIRRELAFFGVNSSTYTDEELLEIAEVVGKMNARLGVSIQEAVEALVKVLQEE